jgi:hypothetical protein
MATENKELYDQLPANFLKQVNQVVRNLERATGSIDRGFKTFSAKRAMIHRVNMDLFEFNETVDSDCPSNEDLRESSLEIIGQAIRLYFAISDEKPDAG